MTTVTKEERVAIADELVKGAHAAVGYCERCEEYLSDEECALTAEQLIGLIDELDERDAEIERLRSAIRDTLSELDEIGGGGNASIARLILRAAMGLDDD